MYALLLPKNAVTQFLSLKRWYWEYKKHKENTKHDFQDQRVCYTVATTGVP